MVGNVVKAQPQVPLTVINALIARFMVPTWGPSGADRTQLGPMLAPWTLLSGWSWYKQKGFFHILRDPRKTADRRLHITALGLFVDRPNGEGKLINRPLLTVESQTPGYSYIDFIPGLPNENTILIIALHFVQLFPTLFQFILPL